MILQNSNVPDIRLQQAPLRPASTSLNSHMTSVSGQTYLHHGQQQPPHLSSIRVSTNPDNIAKQTVVQKNKILNCWFRPTKAINKIQRVSPFNYY